MDLKHFSQDVFNLHDWVNNVFTSPEAKESKDVKHYASSLVMRLQLAIQEVNNSIEETGSQIVTTLPRVLRDVESLSHEASILKNQMNTVKKDIEMVERNTANSMLTLVCLDKVKSRLSASSQALKEADNWTTLSSDIEEIMDGGNIELISSKLIALQNCLGILTHVPDYEDRVAHLEGLKVRLEAILSPHLVSAFGKHNLEDSKKYAKILSSLGRSRNLESYYYKCETQQLMCIWRSSVEGHVMSGNPVWLTAFYEELSSLITKQVKWCEQVFKDSNPVLLLAELTYSVLNTLDPSISQVVSIAVKQQEEPLAFLCTVKKVGEDFLEDYGKVVSSNDDYIQINTKVVETVYKPLKEQLVHYQDYEESLLLSHLISSDVVQEDISESIRLLTNYCKKIVSQTEFATERCLMLSAGYVFPSLIKSLNTYIENFMEKFAQVSRHVEQQNISIQDDWTVFNTCLSLIQASGEFLIAVDGLEHTLSTVLLNVASKTRLEHQQTASVFSLLPEYIVTDSQINALKLLIENSIDNDQRLLERCIIQTQSQSEKCVDVALSTIMAPISSQLAPVVNLPSWNTHSGSTTNLSATFSPQEYITQIGQYLMTLPQHLEPLLMNHSPSLNRALQESDSRSENRIVSESEISAADFLINSVSQSTCRIYTDIILKIPEIATNMITQLTTDIDYICNIFEDLGVSSCEPLDKLNILLKAPADEYWKVAPGNNPRLVAAVRQMRDIPAKS